MRTERTSNRLIKGRYLPYRLWCELAGQPGVLQPDGKAQVFYSRSDVCRRLRISAYRFEEQLKFLEAFGLLTRISSSEVHLTVPAAFTPGPAFL
jgi:hypothetical protein